MFTGIQIAKDETAAGEETCFTGLLGCHARIRHFTEVARKLGEAHGQPTDHIQSAAAGVYRYFTVALPLHEADENQSVDPRVQKFVPEQHLANASALMVVQHREINDVIRRLVPMWEALQERPERLSKMAIQMRHDVAQLQHLFDSHLRLEEEVVYPAMRKYIPQSELDAIRAEMQARRA